MPDWHLARQHLALQDSVYIIERSHIETFASLLGEVLENIFDTDQCFLGVNE